MAFDIKDLYVNIPIQETLNITREQLKQHNNTQTTEQITTLLETILKQNYLSFQNNIYQPTQGVAMGSPISGLVTEIFLQHLEQNHLRHLLDTQHILYYTRYVDDILLVYDTRHITNDMIQNYIKNIHPT
jgi:hypothetical protein